MGVTWWNLQSQLLLAINSDDPVRAKQLLADGVDADSRFLRGTLRKPALCLCVERNSLELVLLLLESGCSVNQSDSRGQTALHLAAGNGQKDLLEVLLQKKASVRALDEQKRTALHWAALNDSSEMAQLLLNFSSAIDPLDLDSRTPLLLACQNRSSSCTARLLLSHGADPKVTDSQGNTALHYASDPQLIKALIASGVSVNTANQAGFTPLHLAVTRTIPSLRCEIIQLLVAAGCHIDQPTPLGQTALHTAVQERDDATALLLLQLQARTDIVDRLGLSPLFYAARDGNLRLVEALLAAGAYRSLQEHDGNNWFRQPHFIAEIHDPIILEILNRCAINSLPLTWLARSAFRSYAREHSSAIAASLSMPPTLVHFINLICNNY